MLAGILVLLFMVENPGDVGLAPYGDAAPAPGARPLAAPAARPSVWRAFTVLADVSGSASFWILFGTFFICGLSTNGLIQTHFISFCADYGMDEVAAASTLAMMGVFDLFGTTISGWLSDRYDNRALLFVYYGLRGLSLLFLPFSTFSFYGLSLFAVFYGLDWIATVPPTVRLSAQQFGKERASIAFGWIYAGHMLGAGRRGFRRRARRAAHGTPICRRFTSAASPAWSRRESSGSSARRRRQRAVLARGAERAPSRARGLGPASASPRWSRSSRSRSTASA